MRIRALSSGDDYESAGQLKMNRTCWAALLRGLREDGYAATARRTAKTAS